MKSSKNESSQLDQSKAIIFKRKADFNLKQQYILSDKKSKRVSIHQNNQSLSTYCKSKAEILNKQTLKNVNLQANDKRSKKIIQEDLLGFSSTKNIRKFKTKINTYKNENIIRKFLNKTFRTNTYRKPVQYNPFEQMEEQYCKKGIYFHQIILCIYFTLSILFTAFFIVFSSITLVFQYILQHENNTQYIYAIGIIWIIIQIIAGFIRVNTVKGIKLQTIKQITLNYLKNKFVVDLLCFASLTADLLSESNMLCFLRLAFLFKLYDSSQKVQKLELKFISCFEIEKKWILIKILIKNFFFAHLLAVALISMTYFQSRDWMDQMNLKQSQWYEQYIWSYYWAINIMLTVGFGDIKAANYQQAICLIFIQTISCLTLAYNINCIGNLLTELRNKDLEKQRNYKTLKIFSEKNKISQEIDEKLSNHIQQSCNASNIINFEKQQQFVNTLPENLKNDLKIEVNYSLLKNIAFFRDFTNKTIRQLAISFENKLTKPGEVINLIDDQVPKIYILKEGDVGHYSKFGNSKLKKIPIDIIKSKNGLTSKLISLQFMNHSEPANFDSRSNGYSVIYELSLKKFVQILKCKDVDFQYYFSQLHKQKSNISEFQVVFCQFCKQNHSKFKCSRLHYAPLKQNVVYKFIQRVNKGKSQRKQFKREYFKPQKSFPFKYFLKSSSTNELSSDKNLVQKQVVASHNSIVLHENILSYNLAFTNQLIVQKQANEKIIGLIGEEKLFWDIELDQSKNYSYYFPENNASRVKNPKKQCKILSKRILKIAG